MSHHTEQKPFSDGQLHDAIQDLRKAILSETNTELGATGNFPDGKISENDEGELRMAVTNNNGTVILDFGKPVHSIGFTTEEAISLGELLIKRAKA